MSMSILTVRGVAGERVERPRGSPGRSVRGSAGRGSGCARRDGRDRVVDPDVLDEAEGDDVAGEAGVLDGGAERI